MKTKKLKKFLGLDQPALQVYFYFLSMVLIYGDLTGFVLDDKRSNLFITCLFVGLGTLLASLLYLGLRKLLRGTGYEEVLKLIAPILSIVYLYRLFDGLAYDGKLSNLDQVLWTGGVFLLQWAFIRLLLGAIKGKKRRGLSLALSLGLQLVFVAFLLFPGFESPARQNLSLDTKGLKLKPAKEFSYGKNMETVDLSPYIYYSGWNKKIRDRYWGFPLSKAPVRGKIYLPENKRAPVLFFIHGNHNMTTPSHLGYDYLGRYLAGKGIAMVSVDENFLNGYLGKGVGKENAARAILLLENVEALFKDNRDENSPLYQAFNEDALFLGGHSRGGEAVHLAADFTKRAHYPNDSTRSLDYPFKIRGLVTLSPTSGQYQPAGHSSCLENIPYLTIQGSHDADVDSFMGDDGYKHVYNTDPGIYKMALYAGFMNHADSNSYWQNDKTLPKSLFYNRKDLLGRSGQEALVARAIGGFMGDVLGGREDFYQNPQSYLPKDLYWIKKERGGERILTNFEEDSLVQTNSLGGEARVTGADSYREKQLDHMNSSGPDVFHGLEISFRSWARYELDFPDLDLSGADYLRLDLENTGEEDLDVRVEIQDEAGRSMELKPGVQNLQGSLPVALTKFYTFNKETENHAAFQSLDFSLENADLKREGLDPGKIRSVKIMFKAKNNGNIILDEVRVGNER